MEETPQPEEIVRRFLAAAADLSDEEAGRLIRRSGETIRQYRLGRVGQLQKSTLRAMKRYLRRAAGTVPEASPVFWEGVLYAVDIAREHLVELEALAEAQGET